MSLSIRWLARFAALFVASACMTGAAAQTALRPNIVLIVSDDQGWKDVGFHGSAIATPTLDKLAGLLIKYNRTVVHVVGHTDSDGSDAYNLDLSRRRADAVANDLIAAGVPANRVRAEGRGEREPRADNATAAGKQLNRRVEIYIKPIVEGQEQRAYEPPAYRS